MISGNAILNVIFKCNLASVIPANPQNRGCMVSWDLIMSDKCAYILYLYTCIINKEDVPKCSWLHIILSILLISYLQIFAPHPGIWWVSKMLLSQLIAISWGGEWVTFCFLSIMHQNWAETLSYNCFLSSSCHYNVIMHGVTFRGRCVSINVIWWGNGQLLGIPIWWVKLSLAM